MNDYLRLLIDLHVRVTDGCASPERKKRGSVPSPPLTWDALARYLSERELPVLPVRRNPQTPVIGTFKPDSDATISSVHLWIVMYRFFPARRESRRGRHAPRADRLHCASPHWMRHTHATYALGRGAEPT
jgi:integrase